MLRPGNKIAPSPLRSSYPLDTCRYSPVKPTKVFQSTRLASGIIRMAALTNLDDKTRFEVELEVGFEPAFNPCARSCLITKLSQNSRDSSSNALQIRSI